MKTVKKIGQLFARPEIVFYTLLWLMVLLVAGTLAQRYIGLYLAQQKYFSTWFFWAGFLPVPSGYTTLAVIFVSLIAKLIFKSPWTRKRIGLNVVHVGAALLLFGGFLTAVFSYEGNMVIPEGESSNVITDYHRVELTIAPVDPPKEIQPREEEVVFAQELLKSKDKLADSRLPFALQVVEFCENCDMVRREIPAGEEYHGFSKIFQLVSISRNKEDEKNQGGVVFQISGTNTPTDGFYAVFEFMPIQQTITYNDKKYNVTLRRQETVVPFSIRLIDFEKKTYAATDMAKSYRSIVILKDGDLEERHIIQMNEPLRYKDYTFYQASFFEGGPTETTVLAVVKNAGRIFPYLSSIVMCVGLLLHLLLQIPNLIEKRKL